MTGPQHIDACSDDIGAWVLGALPDVDAERFAAHLHDCDACAHEVATLQFAADHLPLAVTQAAPPPQLHDRLMAVVRREAELLAAAGAGADRPGRARTRHGRAWGWIAARPLAASACAGVILLTGLGIGLTVESPGTDTTTIGPRVIAATNTGDARGVLVTGAQGAELMILSLASPSRGHVYQAWIRRGKGLPTPAGVFTVDRQGRAAVALRGSVAGAREVLVTEEPDGGSSIPSTDPRMRVRLG